MKALRKVGDIEIVKYVWLWRECEECGNPARFKLTFLYQNARSNPASRGYRKDDVSWCQDAERFACGKHENKIWNDPPQDNMSKCSSFPLKNFQHMGFYKERML